MRILQEESTIVCFMRLLWQTAGDESRGTWGAGQEDRVRPPTSQPRRIQETLPASPATPAIHATPRPTPPLSPMRLGGGRSGKQASRVLQRAQTYFAGVGTLRVHFPRIPKVHRVLFQLEAAAGEVIVLDTIKIPAQATHPLLTDKMRSIVRIVNLGANSLTPGQEGSLGQRGGRLVRGRGGRQRDEDGDPEADQGNRQSRVPAKVSPRLPHAAPLKAKQVIHEERQPTPVPQSAKGRGENQAALALVAPG